MFNINSLFQFKMPDAADNEIREPVDYRVGLIGSESELKCASRQIIFNLIDTVSRSENPF